MRPTAASPSSGRSSTSSAGLFQPLEQEVARATAARGSLGRAAPRCCVKPPTSAPSSSPSSSPVCSSWPWGCRACLTTAPTCSPPCCSASPRLRSPNSAAASCRVVTCSPSTADTSRPKASAACSSPVRFVIVGIEVVGAYAITLAAAFLLGTFAAGFTVRPFVNPGPPSHLNELSPPLGLLLATSISEAFLLNVGPVALAIIGDELGEEAPGVFLNGLIISRIPLFFFQAVKASLLPALAARAADDDLDGFREVQLRLVGAVAVVAAGPRRRSPWSGRGWSRPRSLTRSAAATWACWRHRRGLMLMLSLSLGWSPSTTLGWPSSVSSSPLSSSPLRCSSRTSRSCKLRSGYSPPRRLVPSRRVSCCASSSPVTGLQVECRPWPNRRNGARARRLTASPPQQCESASHTSRSTAPRSTPVSRSRPISGLSAAIRASRTPRPPGKNPIATVIAPATDSASACVTVRSTPITAAAREIGTHSPQASLSRRGGWRARGGPSVVGAG